MDAGQKDAAEAAVEALLDLHAPGDTPSAESLVEAAFSVLASPVVDTATLYALSLDAVTREEAIFTAPGGMTLSIHRGDWMERGRPAKMWITAQHALEPYTAV